MLDRLFDRLEETKQQLSKGFSRFKNREFLQATVAAGTFIAYIDGVVTAEEKAKLIKFVQLSDVLSAYSATDVLAEFKRTSEKFDYDLDVGRAAALELIGKVRGNRDQSELLVRFAVVIAKADGHFGLDEKAGVSTICKTLDLNAGDFY